MNGPPRFDKFGWLKALRHDPVITGTSAFHVGVDLCTTFTRGDGTGWVFKLAELPDIGGKPLTRNTVNAAIRVLKDRGFILVTHRSHGGRGVVAAMSVDLIPVRSNVPVSTDTGPTGDAGLRDTGPIEPEGFDENLHVPTSKPAQLNVETGPIERTKNRPEQRQDPPSGTSSGTSSGEACARDDEPAAPAPDPLSDDHPEDQPADEPAPAPATAGPSPRRRTMPPPTPAEVASAADLPRPPMHWPKSFPESDPGEFCAKHPRGTNDRCPQCGDARKARAVWDTRRQAFNAELAAAKRAWVRACPACDDEHGDLLGPDGSVLDTAVRCVHIRLWEAYWAGRGVIPLRTAA